MRRIWANTDEPAGIRLIVVREGGPRVACSSPSDGARLFMESQPHDGREHFRAAFLDTRHRLIGPAYLVSIGCLTASLVHPRELFRPAIAAGAAGVVLSHNHPSGDPEPSAEDIALTRRLVAAGTVLGIEVLDHIVTGEGRYVSLKERGVL